jgi:hypothetical protein
MFKGRCAECNAEARSKAFKSRRAGYDVPGANERRLRLAFESAQNNKICKACYLKNYKALKQLRDEQNTGDISRAKKLRLDVPENENDVLENVNGDIDEIEVRENAAVAEKEGTAISVLLQLSML